MSLLRVTLAVVAVLGGASYVAASEPVLCLFAYADSECSGTGVWQGTLKGGQWTPAPDHGCSPGLAYGRVEPCGGGGEKRCDGAPPECSPDKCLAPDCVLYAHCWGCNRAVGQFYDPADQPLPVADPMVDSARRFCSYFGRGGNGFAAPSSGTLAEVGPDTVRDASAAMSPSAVYLIDPSSSVAPELRPPPTPQDDVPSDEEEPMPVYWAPGNPVEGSKLVGLMKNGTDEVLAVSLSGKVENLRVLCQVAEAVLPVPTPPPPAHFPGECRAEDPLNGTLLVPCKPELNCTDDKFSTLSSALEACCAAPDNSCTGVVRDGITREFRLGTGDPSNDSFPSASSVTFLRTPESFLPPVIPPPAVMHPGLSVFFLFLLGLLMTITIYCAVGIALKVQQGEVTCPEVLPNYEFWLAIPGGLKACCSEVCNCLTAPGYATVGMDLDEMDVVDNDPMQD